jgi:hypothetical protein
MLFTTLDRAIFDKLVFPMTKLLMIAALCSAAVAVPVNAGVKVLGERVAKSEICPGASTSKCVMKSGSATATYIGNDRRYVSLSPQEEPILEEYLGHQFTREMAKSTPFCQNLSTDVLKKYAADQGIEFIKVPYQNSFRMETKVKNVIDAQGGVDAKAAAVAAGVPAGQLDAVAAAVSAAYRRVRNRKVQISGVFRFYEINPAILTTFASSDAPANLAACRDWLAQQDEQLIVSLTGYKLEDAKATLELASNFNSELKAKLNNTVTEGQIASIGAAFSNEVERKVEQNFPPNFELLSVATTPRT